MRAILRINDFELAERALTAKQKRLASGLQVKTRMFVEEGIGEVSIEVIAFRRSTGV